MLWRTRPLGALMALGLAVLASLPLVETRVEIPASPFALSVEMSGVRMFWGEQVVGAVAVLAAWVWLILRRPVGEVALHRHVATVVAVGVVGYLWLVTPSLLALVEVHALRRVEISDRMLESDREVLARYAEWSCIPPAAWKGERELAQVRNVLGRYRRGVELNLEPTQHGCDEQDARRLDRNWAVSWSIKDIAAIKDARSLGSGLPGPNQFSHLRASFSWFAPAALGMGILAAALSYPSYVWRRTFLRRLTWP
jgi:hypothetical protein